MAAPQKTELQRCAAVDSRPPILAGLRIGNRSVWYLDGSSDGRRLAIS